jgi:hypothetical protein
MPQRLFHCIEDLLHSLYRRLFFRTQKNTKGSRVIEVCELGKVILV